jgi:leucyl-tRNA synthetase
MINQYGADAVRWFILSDSPPEKDIQWSDTGVSSANKFLQKIWNLNFLISKRGKTNFDNSSELEFALKINNYLVKIDNTINTFRFNVSIAHFHEVYKIFKDNLENSLSTDLLTVNLIKIMKLMIPLTPHLAYECLELLNCKTTNQWPEIDKQNVFNQIKFAIQVNGKTRDVVNLQKNLEEKDINKIVLKNLKVSKHLKDKKILRTIFIKNKIINYII